MRGTRTLAASVLLAVAPSFVAHAQTGSRLYRDLAGRFAVTVPDGWRSAAQNGGVVLSSGGSSVVLSPVDNAPSADAIVAALAGQIARQWSEFAPLNRGPVTIGGAPGTFAMFTGRNPSGSPAMLRVIGVMAGGRGYAVVVSTTRQEFNLTVPTFQAIERSITLAGAPTPMPAAETAVQPPPKPVRRRP